MRMRSRPPWVGWPPIPRCAHVSAGPRDARLSIASAGIARSTDSRRRMPPRRRWTPARGTGLRLEDPVERALAALVDLPARIGGGPRGTPIDPAALRDVLVV